MAKKITELTELTSLASADIFAVVDDPGGTPVTKKITSENLFRYYNPIDAPPASHDAKDDEFDGVSLDAKWTERNFQGDTADVVGGGLWNISGSGGNYRIAAIEQDISGSSWKFRTKYIWESPAYSYIGPIICVKDSVSGRISGFSILFHSAHGYNSPIILHNSAYDTFVSETTNDTWVVCTEGYLELEYDGTSFYFRHSRSGVNYIQIMTETQAAYVNATPTQIAIGVHLYNSSNKFSCSFDWFRKVA